MRVPLVLTACVLTVTIASAQTFRGGIQGAVTDQTRAALPGVTVTATNTGTGLTRSVQTDESGAYAFPELPLGLYDVSASLMGFATQTVRGVAVDAAASQRVNLELRPGGVQESVEVVGRVPLVDTTRNTQGGTIEGKEAAEIPLNGRDFVKLLTLVPGSAGDPSGINDSPGSFGLFSINGNRGRSNNYLLDGTDMNDGYRNLPAINEAGVFGTPATVLPIDAVDEFPVLSGAEAEYGRNAGAIVNIVTKSGTNTPGGSVYEYFRDDALGNRNYFNKAPAPRNEFRNNQFGGSIGGPVRKDRTFFFAAYEGQRENGGLPGPARVPTDDELSAAVAANGGVMNPVIRGLLDRRPWPAPNQAPDDSGNNLQATTLFRNRVDSALGKIDQHLGTGDLLTVRYFFGDSDQSFPLGLLGGGFLPGYNTETPTTVHLLSGSYTRIISPNLLVELRGGLNRFDEDFFPEDADFDPRTVGLNTVTNPLDFGLPLIRVAGYANAGANLSLPRGRVDSNYQAFGNVSYTTGRHNWKAGYEFRRTTVDGFFDAGYRGRLDFDSLEDFVAGRLSGGRQARGDSRRFTFQNSHGLYAQDSMQVRRNVTVNWGVRWDYYGVIGEEQDRFSVFDTAASRVTPVTQLYDKDWNNVSPRASVAWDLTGEGETVVRAGYGLYYDAFSQDFFVGQLPWNTFNPGPAYNDILFSFEPVGELEPGAPVFADESFSASDVFTVDRNLRTPYVQTYNVNLQRELGSRAAAQVGYVGSTGKSLFRYRDINQLDPATGDAPFPDFLYINHFESTAHSRYNGLQASLRIRDWHGLTSTVNYTLSKSMDTASDGQDYVPNATQPDDSRNPEAEWAPSNFDARHRFTWYFTWDISRAETGRPLTSGWSVNGVVTLASGQPININYLFEDDFNGSGEYFGRPDLVGDPFAGTGGPDRFLNLSAFAAPCTPNGEGGCAGGQHFGNLPRNAYYGPGFRNVDLSLVKNTRLKGRTTLQVRMDVFNITNHTNFANPLLPNFAIDFLQNGIDPETNRGIGFLPLTATPDVAGGNPFLGGGGPRAVQLAGRVSF
ncbi:MAG TPA: carboxypeptidase regulatory-like domain-containing protein [Vicinamibacterales bacterium]|nr:carboxypeptidase regulatory-like domain-containing protein [Vicinamibacterales bacterium]